MKEGTKAQISAFIVIAIIIIVIGGGIFLFRSESKDHNVTTEASPVYSFIESCMEDTIRDGIVLVGLQGGYYNKEVLSERYLLFEIPYYWNSDGRSEVPEVSTIESELSIYLKDNLNGCVNNFDTFDDSIYTIESEIIEIKSVRLNDNGVIVEADYPVTITTGEKTSMIYKFDLNLIPTELKGARDASEQIIEEQKKDPNEMPLGFIAQLASNNGFEFETILDDDNVIYSLIYNPESDSAFIYAFAADYNWEDILQ